MILLQPVTSSQTIKIVPRSYKADSNVQVIITEDGTRKTQTLTSLTSSYVGNFIQIPCSFNILSEGKMYLLEFTRSGNLLFRSKAYCTAQTNRTIPHTLNTSEYTEHSADAAGQKYLTI
tara:strand:+ start:12921 stop:13277 length:357 start_codon:yes stop_codon:yes gene_type:complete